MRGGSLVEYIILLGVVALLAISAFRRFSSSITLKLRAQGQTIALLGDVQGGVGSSSNPDCVGGVCSNPDQCFAAGTLVSTAAGLRAIEQVKVGDLVWSRDPQTAELALKPVLERYVTRGQRVLDLHVAVGSEQEIVRATPAHRFWVSGRGWTRADSLSMAQPLSLRSGESGHLAEAATSEADLITVYNFEVADYHSYFVGRHAIWVHNGCTPGASNVTPTGPPTPPVPPNGDVVVIGSREDTLVAKSWPNHQVLDDPSWTIATNDAWVAQAIDRGATVYLASPQTHDTLWDDSAGRERVYQRELDQFKRAGYTQVGDYMVPPGTTLPTP